MKKFKAPFKKNEYQPHHPYAQWKSYLKLLVCEVFSINFIQEKHLEMRLTWIQVLIVSLNNIT